MVFLSVNLAEEERDLAGFGLVRFSQALAAQFAGYAILLRPLEPDRQESIDFAIFAIAI